MFSTVTRSDIVWLVCASAIAAFCGVFGCSYVIGQGWPSLELWAEILLTVVFTPIAALVFLLFDKALSVICKSDKHRSFDVLTPKWNVSSIAFFTLIMCACWLIWYIANLPGGAYWDTYYQIFQVYPENHPISIIPWSDVYKKTLTDAWLVDHHPVLVTMIYGAFGWVSDQLTGNWMAGVAAFCALQGIVSCAVFTSACAYLRSRGCPLGVCFVSYLFFAFIPFVPTWAMCMVKDSMFGLVFIPYMMMLIETVMTHGAWLKRRSHCVWIVVAAVLLCLIKKQAIFVVVITSIVGFFIFRAKKQTEGQAPERQVSQLQEDECEDRGVRQHRMHHAQIVFILQSVISLALVCIVLPCFLFPVLNIEKGGTQETLGPAFQQTARVLVDYPDDVSDEERRAIEAVLDYDKIVEDYQFDFEDAVKYRYNLDASAGDIFNYLQVYVAQGLRHPDSYFAAWMSLAGFYVAPCAYVNIRMTTVDTKMGPQQRHMLWNPDELDGLREGLDDIYKRLASTPVIDAPLLLVAYTFWLPLALMFVCVHRRFARQDFVNQNAMQCDFVHSNEPRHNPVQYSEEYLNYIQQDRACSNHALQGEVHLAFMKQSEKSQNFTRIGGIHWMLVFVPVLVLCVFCYIAPVYDARYAIPIFDAAPLLFGFVCLQLAIRN